MDIPDEFKRVIINLLHIEHALLVIYKKYVLNKPIENIKVSHDLDYKHEQGHVKSEYKYEQDNSSNASSFEIKELLYLANMNELYGKQLRCIKNDCIKNEVDRLVDIVSAEKVDIPRLYSLIDHIRLLVKNQRDEIIQYLYIEKANKVKKSTLLSNQQKETIIKEFVNAIAKFINKTRENISEKYKQFSQFTFNDKSKRKVRKSKSKRKVRKSKSKRKVRKSKCKRKIRKSKSKRKIRKSKSKRKVRKSKSKRKVRKSKSKRKVRKSKSKRKVRKSKSKRRSRRR